LFDFIQVHFVRSVCAFSALRLRRIFLWSGTFFIFKHEEIQAYALDCTCRV